MSKYFYQENLASFDYFQPELKNAFFQAGGKNNQIITNQEDQLVDLVDEPENHYDPNAIAVYAFGQKIGYIAAYDTDLVRKIPNKEIELRLYYFKSKNRAEITIKSKANNEPNLENADCGSCAVLLLAFLLVFIIVLTVV